jgi:putative transposase
MANGARARELALLPAWSSPSCSVGAGSLLVTADRHKGSHRHMANRLSEEERQRILLTCKEPEFAALPRGQIVPVWPIAGFISVRNAALTSLHSHGQFHACGPQVRISCGAGT